MRPKITAASTALFSTWVFVENLGLLLDAGDGVCASLGQKSRKIRHVFVTHADRDHLCGLLQLHQLNARDGRPSIYYPKDCGSFPALRDFVEKFDPQSGPATWTGLSANQEIPLSKEFFIQTGSSAHVTSGNLVKALDFTVCSMRKSLKPELRNLEGQEIAQRRRDHGESAITEIVTENLIGYSGDAPRLNPSRWSGVKVLLHEATFLEPETARNAHANLPQVIEAASGLTLEALVLMHFSARYSAEEIQEAIRKHAEEVSLGFPVFAILPGEVTTDILSTHPVWTP